MTQASDAMLARVALVRLSYPRGMRLHLAPNGPLSPGDRVAGGFFAVYRKRPRALVVMVGAILGLLKLKGVW